ncbi:MAG TPA: hypothetical protein VFR19_13945, partial [Hyphomicrobiaceae bacterium]|nr:hypothetical protein [Hyphomicrobiaceae bacterium]
MAPPHAPAWRKLAQGAWRSVGASVSLLAALQAGPAALGQPASSPMALVEQGRRIYETGQLGSGEPLLAKRGEQGMAVTGQAAACINCHQKSG